jgi:hypothetical protein
MFALKRALVPEAERLQLVAEPLGECGESGKEEEKL